MAKRRSLVSIIILTHNLVDITLQCLQALVKNSNYSSIEIILIDNGSTRENTRKLKRGLSRFIFDHRLIVLAENKGFQGN